MLAHWKTRDEAVATKAYLKYFPLRRTFVSPQSRALSQNLGGIGSKKPKEGAFAVTRFGLAGLAASVIDGREMMRTPNFHPCP
jgi:hypothetical protein